MLRVWYNGYIEVVLILKGIVMIKLKSVSKFYSQNGIVASGINKVSLDFKVGEFIAITGESGSGKSTLLNVISGLDTYEEGEMYIGGEETSHFSEKDYEDYRRKYVGNIFQNFNLVGSYTVYQNIELALILNGETKKEAKSKVLSLIDKVGLNNIKNTKTSKLSGGQKQRVAIARALAKDSPIIIADEPTGNLDSKSAKEIIELLHEISKEKLVIIVTHNYEQVANYVTRKITMYDGKILEDDKISNVNEKYVRLPSQKPITFKNKVRLTLRNTFNIIPKFLLLFLVFALLTAAILGKYSYDQKQKEVAISLGHNWNFSDTSIERLIVKNKDNVPLTEEDFETISTLDNIDQIVKDDLSLDYYLELVDENEYNYFFVSPRPIGNFKGELDYGRMPENDSELVLQIYEYAINPSPEGIQEIWDSNFSQSAYSTAAANYISEYKIVGIQLTEAFVDKAYGSDAFLKEASIFQKTNVNPPSVYLDDEIIAQDVFVVIDDTISKGTAYVNEEMYYDIINETIVLEYEDMNYTNNVSFEVTDTLSVEEFSEYYADVDFEYAKNTIIMNRTDFNKLYGGANYQSSVFVEEFDLIDETVVDLENLGYMVLKISDTLILMDVFDTINTFVTISMIIVLFFVAYFVIRLIMASRKNYFTTLRILGADLKVLKKFVQGELLVISTLVYGIFLLITYVVEPSYSFFVTIRDYTDPYHLLIVYVILLFMSYFLGVKVAGKLFKSSAITTLNQEV